MLFFPTFTLLFAVLLTYLPYELKATSADESSTGALLKFPYADVSSLQNVEWEVAPSQFGYHDYGGSIEAWILLPANTTYHTECTQEPSGLNEYIHHVEDWEIEDSTFLMLIDRGSCYFTDKVSYAEALGASAVIVLDYVNESLFTMWPTENYDDEINIPSVLLGYQNAITLMQAINVSNWYPNSIGYTSYPDPETEMIWVKARLEWGLPHPDDRVEWELWTSSNDDSSLEFKRNFRDTSVSLSSANDTIFTPHMYILNGSHWSCDTGSYRCGTQCTNGGRYCSVDPEYDLSRGLDGMDVVQENLRSLCVWNYSMYVYENESIWWDYAILWDRNCYNGTNNETTFTQTCSFQQMNLLDLNLVPYVNNCINITGGYGYKDGVNYLLAAEVSLREGDSIYSLPSVIVNEFTIHGNIDCEIVTTATCQVLDAICAGFINGTEPDICDVSYCNDTLKDCSGTCLGTKETDACSQCLELSDPLWDSCVGCDNVVWSNKTYDCQGTCGGNYSLNSCGYCINKNRVDFNSYGKDCNGTCNGDYENDSCGQCTTPSDPKWNYCIGCDNVAWSNKTKDCKGVCGGSASYYICTTGVVCMDSRDTTFNTSCFAYDSTSSPSNNSSTNTSMSIVITISIISLIVVIIAGCVMYKLWQKQKQSEQRFGNLMKQYSLMDENPTNKQTKMGSNHNKQPVPTEEEE